MIASARREFRHGGIATNAQHGRDVESARCWKVVIFLWIPVFFLTMPRAIKTPRCINDAGVRTRAHDANGAVSW